MHACYRRILGFEASHLAALGDTALDVLEFNIVGVIGLNVSSKAVQGALDGLLGGRVHHAGLFRKLAG